MKTCTEKAITDYIEKTRIPVKVKKTCVPLASQICTIADASDGLTDAAMRGYDYGFARGWRAAQSYQRREAATI